MKGGSEGGYQKPRLEGFGRFRDLTLIGCTLGGDGIWICREPTPDVTPPNGVDRS